MDLIERYVHDVGRRLPKGKRADVETELRSLLQDMVEDRAGAPLAEADEDVVLRVLREMGPPQKVAASYQPKSSYLIGPQFYPVFRVAFSATAAVMTVVVFAGVLLSVDFSGPFLQDALQLIVEAAPGLFNSLVMAFAIIVIIMALVERFVPDEDIKLQGLEGEWDPRKLPTISGAKRIDRFGALVTIVINLFVLIMVNLYPYWIGLPYRVDGVTVGAPILSENFFAVLLPWYNASVIAVIILNIYQLFVGRMTRGVRAVSILADLVSAAVIYVFITNGPIFGLNESLMTAQGWPTTGGVVTGAEALVSLFNTIARIALPIAFLATLFSAGVKVFRLFTDSSVEPPLTPVGKAG